MMTASDEEIRVYVHEGGGKTTVPPLGDLTGWHVYAIPARLWEPYERAVSDVQHAEKALASAKTRLERAVTALDHAVAEACVEACVEAQKQRKGDAA